MYQVCANKNFVVQVSRMGLAGLMEQKSGVCRRVTRLAGEIMGEPLHLNTYIQKSFCAKLKIVIRRKIFFHQEKNFQFGAELFTRFKCLNIKYIDDGKKSYRFSDNLDKPPASGIAQASTDRACSSLPGGSDLFKCRMERPRNLKIASKRAQAELARSLPGGSDLSNFMAVFTFPNKKKKVNHGGVWENEYLCGRYQSNAERLC